MFAGRPGFVIANVRNRYNVSFFPFVFLAIIVFFIARSPSRLLYPLMSLEDGSVVFPYYFANANFLDVFRFYAGYVSVYQNVVGYLGSCLPIWMVPYFYSLASFVLSVFIFSMFSTSLFRHIISSDSVRAGICLFVALVPIGNHELIYTLVFSQWSLLVVMALICFIEVPRQKTSILFLVVLGLFASCSSPIVVIFLPLIAYRIWQSKNGQTVVYFSGLLAVVLAYLFWAVDYGQATYPHRINIKFVGELFNVVVQRIVLEALYGPWERVWVGDNFAVMKILLSATLLVTCITFSVIGWGINVVRRVEFWLVVGYFIFVPTVVVVLTRGFVVLSGDWGHRYLYLQSFALIMCVAFLSIGPLRALNRKKMMLIFSLVALFFIDQYRFDKRGLFHRVSPDHIVEGKRVAQFFGELDASRMSEKILAPLVLERSGRWSIIIPNRQPK